MTLLARLGAWRLGKWRNAARAGDCLAVLPLLRAQLQETAQQIEQAVVKVCGNFSGIAERSRKAVDKTAELLGGNRREHDAGVEQSIETSRVTIATLLERLERSATVSSQVVTGMEEVEKAMSGIHLLVADLQKIAFSNKLVGLNAKIEAVHVGQLGAGFEVVADEISRQSDRSNELAEEVGARVREMGERVNAAAIDLRGLVSGHRETLLVSRRDAEGALDLLRTALQRGRDSMEMMASESAALAGQISEAIIGLQFQDRTSQRLAHVVEALEKVEHSLGGASRASSTQGPDTPAEGQELLDDVRAAYTMESERTVLTRSRQETAQAPSDGDVELF